jgi:hypothetical protein
MNIKNLLKWMNEHKSHFMQMIVDNFPNFCPRGVGFFDKGDVFLHFWSPCFQLSDLFLLLILKLFEL